MNAVLSFILVLGILIFVHELGHFLFSKLFKVRVLKFSLGFGNKLIGKQWGETEYLISAFPLGGYVKMYGEQPGEEVAEADKEVSFSHKTVGQRFWIVFGGPLFNLLFAVLVFWLMFVFAGMPDLVDTTKIGEVSVGSAAEKAGLLKGDLILTINDHKMTSWEQVSSSVKESGGKKMQLVVQRGKEVLTIEATPVRDKVKNIFGEPTEERYLLGMSRAEDVVYSKVSLLESVMLALEHTWSMIVLTVMGLVKMLQRIIPASELGGPIRIAEIAGEQFKAGWINLIHFTGLLSVNLGILNLLPIPILDGGHLVFLSIEAIRRKPMGEMALMRAQQVGMALLGTLMIFVFYNDIARLVQRWM
ncbi:MAG: site-2 protease, Metallo peptidase, MEROPS family M50B [Candidatus Electronema aureum]|uniref:Zinc metalloprotease n=1 Tax=Candidatus Electronema aureum TaxID=2005002 RepID=A0A521G510_9BACT|nr:MAG: site-2 protease, Metallo peptidase, MEROPS family M50B [Candidatus Electronema aureum]